MNGAVRFYKKKQTKDGKTMRRTKEKEIVVKEGDSRISLVYVQQIILFKLNASNQYLLVFGCTESDSRAQKLFSGKYI